MPLIECPECRKEISNVADSCPSCGYPIAGGGSTQAHGGKIQTIEKTSKRYKLHMLLSTMLIIGSIIAMISGHSGEQPNPNAMGFGMLGLMAGLIWFIIVRFITWWHHG